MAPIEKLNLELRWWTKRKEIDDDLCYVCEAAADVLDRTRRLCEAIDNYTKEPNGRNWTEVILARKELK